MYFRTWMSLKVAPSKNVFQNIGDILQNVPEYEEILQKSKKKKL